MGLAFGDYGSCGVECTGPARDIERRQSAFDAQRTLTTAQSVLIVGGGAVGVELCGELANKKCILATTELVPDLPVKDKVLRSLQSRGVQVHFARARRLSEHTYDVGGEEIEVDACLWCFGGRPQTAFLPSDLLDDRGFVAIDPYRRSLKFPQMYACGDVASKSDGQRLASYAHIEGEYVAHHILASLRGREISPYSPPPRFVALSLGPRDGCFVYDSIAFPMPGFLVPWLKGLIEAWFIRLLPMPYALLSLLPGDVTARTWSKRPRTVS
ncbi:MAG: FAD-dependent oxidoreductase [Pseudomonadota bacterium]